MIAGRAQPIALGVAPALVLLASLGLVSVAVGNNAARADAAGAAPLFWLGLALIVVPTTFRLIGGPAQRAERITLVVTLGLGLYLVKVLHSPDGFTRFDEFGFWRATYDLAVTGDPFSRNPITEASAGYPALSLVTQALASLTGLSIFHAGLIVIGVARVVFVLALFLFLERILDSSRIAGVGVILYACNSSFLYFDAQFAYESLGLMFVVALLLAVAQWLMKAPEAPRNEVLAFAGMILIVAAGLVVTHHVSSIFVLGVLVLWAGLRGVGFRRGWDISAGGPRLLPIVLAIAAMTGIWFGFVAGDSTVSELGELFSTAVGSAFDLIAGESSSKQPFSGTGVSTTLVERGAILISVLVITAVIVLGLFAFARQRVRRPVWLTLAAVAVLWPIALAMRLTAESTEISGRAPQFVFLGVALLGVYLIARFLLPHVRGRRLTAARALLAALIAITFAGGVIFGELKETRQPGPYLVGAEDRSVTPEGFAAARFVEANLPPRSAVLSDRTNAALLGSYGGLDPVFGSFDNTPLSRVLSAKRLGDRYEDALIGLSVQFVLVDTRLVKSLPVLGYYVDPYEPRARRITRDAVEKFDPLPDASRIYSNGPIAIYDTSVLSQ